MKPVTLDEWAVYIDTLSGEELRSKAMAANSLSFLRDLEGEGISPLQTMEILRLFAKRFTATKQEPPSRYDGALVNYGQLLDPIPLPTENLDAKSIVARFQARSAR